MRKTHICIVGMLMGLLTLTLPMVSAVEYNVAVEYNREQLYEHMRGMSVQELREFVQSRLADQEPDGLVTIALYLLYSVLVSLLYVVPALLWLLVTVIV